MAIAIQTIDEVIDGVFYEKGVYFGAWESGLYISEFTINGYTGFNYRKLKEEYLPEHEHEYGIEGVVYADDIEDVTSTVLTNAETLGGKTENMLSVAKAVDSDTLGGKTEDMLYVARAVDADNLGGISAANFMRKNEISNEMYVNLSSTYVATNSDNYAAYRKYGNLVFYDFGISVNNNATSTWTEYTIATGFPKPLDDWSGWCNATDMMSQKSYMCYIIDGSLIVLAGGGALSADSRLCGSGIYIAEG